MRISDIPIYIMCKCAFLASINRGKLSRELAPRVRTAVRETLALAEDDVRCALRTMDADIQAALALNRATLRALAALSPLLNTAADAALEDEAEQAADRAAPQRTLDIVTDARRRLQKAPAEAKIARALQLALVDAAEALPARTARVA